MKNADQSTDEVVGVGFGAEITAVNSALYQGDESAVYETSRTFDETQGAAGDSVHCGNDEPFVGHVVDKEQHPRAKGFDRRHASGESLPRIGEFFHFVAVDGFDQGVAGGEMAVERAGADARLTGDIVKAGGGAIASEDFLCDLQDAFAVALGIRPGLAGGRGWRELLLRQM